MQLTAVFMKVEDGAAWTPRRALGAARAVADRTQPWYVGTEHLVIALLEGSPNRLVDLLSACGVDADLLRESLAHACAEWAREQGWEPDNAATGGLVPTPKLLDALHLACPVEGGFDGRVSPLVLFVALLRVGDTLVARFLGDRIVKAFLAAADECYQPTGPVKDA
jgi:ATP-dependent Clp protease ATP-binding subunit ClpA